jgi:hypothetical protein
MVEEIEDQLRTLASIHSTATQLILVEGCCKVEKDHESTREFPSPLHQLPLHIFPVSGETLLR